MIKLNSIIITLPTRPKDMDLVVYNVTYLSKTITKRAIFSKGKTYEQYVHTEYITTLTRGWAMAFDMLPRFNRIRLDHLQ